MSLGGLANENHFVKGSHLFFHGNSMYIDKYNILFDYNCHQSKFMRNIY